MIMHLLRAAHVSKSFFCLIALLAFAGSNAQAADVVLIEEHWELHVGGPDTARSAPQVTMAMSPTDDVEGDFFILTLNHWSYPNFSAGGIQVQRWHGEDCQEVAQCDSETTLNNDQEIVAWVQRISLADSKLKFEVVNGTSQSWGTFGNNGQLTLTHPTYLTRLNKYRPAVSIDESGIAYAGNRVSSLVLKRLKWQTSDGENHELVAPIDIATSLDP